MRTDKLIVIAANFLLACGSAGAAVYKTVDQQGNVVYSDEPTGNAEPIKLPPLSTVPPPQYGASQVSGTDPDAESAGADFYKELLISSPAPDETLRNTGDVGVKIRLEPALDKKAGHRLQYFLDGQVQGEPTTSDKALFTNIDRGAHTVEVAVVDASGNQLQRSASVRFYLHRHSLNSPTAPGKPVPLPRR